MKTKTKKLLLVLLSLALLLSLIAVVASASASTSDGNDAQTGKKINVWLIAGQSNAVGYGITSNYPEGYSDGAALNSGIQNVLYYGKGFGNDTASFVPVTFGLGKDTTYSGPEIGIATALSESGEQHVIIKYASGDTQLSATKATADNNIKTWTPPSYVAAHPEITFEGDKIGDLYDGFISTVNEAVTKLKADGYTPVVQGLWWMQGERDSNYGSMTADLYSTLLKTLISDVRRDVGTIIGEDLSDMPTVFGRIYCNPANEPLSAIGLAAVQAAQDAVSLDQTLKNVAMLDTRYDLTDPESGEARDLVQQDKWHYDTLTQQMIGEAFVRKAYAIKDTQDETDKSVYIEGYGTIPADRADANTYPIVLFQNGELKGVYAKTDFKAAYKAAHDLTTAAGAPAAKILLRGDAEFEGTAYADKVGSSFSEIDINLGGHTLTHTGSSFVFYLRMLSHTAKGETFTLNIRNGNIASVNYVMFGVGAMYEGSDASVKLTNVDINMTDVNITFNEKGWNSGPIFYNQGTTNNANDKEIEFDLTMTDCTLDLTKMTKANAIFDTVSSHTASTNGKITKIHAFNIEINGGELILGKGNNSGRNPYDSSLYTLNDYSSISFGKGSDGNYLKITVPTDVTSSIIKNTITIDTGAECVFVKAMENGGFASYRLYPSVMLGYKIKSSVTLHSNLVYNIYVPATDAVSAVYIDGESVVLDDSMITEIDGTDYYRIQVSLPASGSLKDIKLDVALKSGEATVNAKWTLNIVNYAKTVISGDGSDVEKALIRDMLSYAASAHTYFKTTGDVVAKLTEIESILGESYDANNKVTVPENAAKKPADNTYFKSIATYLGEIPSFRFYLANGYQSSDFTFTVGGRKVEAIAIDTNSDGIADCLEIVMYAYMMLDDVSYTVVNKDSGLSVTEYYNLYAYYNYVNSLTGDAADADLVNIVERLMKYAESARVYRAYVTNYHEHSFDSTVKAEATAFTKGTVEHKCSYCGYTYTEVIPTTLKILAVGNSFSVDAMEHLYLVAKNAGIENVVLGNLYIASCSISTHWTKMNNDAADYTFYVSDDTVGGMVTEGTRTAKYGITYTDWDYITIQQSSSNSGLDDTFNDLQSVIDYINSNKTSDAEILWHMTWAYQQNSTHGGFANYNNNQTTMYNSIVSVVNELILTNSDISRVIPAGTAIQNLRTSPLGDTLTRDGHHMSYGIGRYTVALTWLAAITGYDIDQITATPETYPEVAESIDYIKEAVKGAIENPYSVMRSNVVWEMGTIASKDGMNSDTNNTNRMRTAGYLPLSDIAGVTANEGYMLLWFAYDKDMNWLGKLSTWASEGAIINTDDIVNSYPNAVYFRIAMRKADDAAMTLGKDLVNSGVAFTATRTPEDQPLELEYERLMNIGACQDGAIWDETLFALNANGTGTVYNLKSLTKVGTFTLDGSDVLKPHANSVCFGNTYYEEGDKYPLLYVSVYNNYQSSSDRMEGTCCVYRITELDGSFTTQLVQVIKIGFTEDLTLWKSIADNGDVRPYGNFFIDTGNNKFYAYVMRDSNKTTRFFGFDIPELSEGVYNDIYGCNLVTLEKTDIKRQFDTEYINYMQGVTYTKGLVISAEGFEYGDSRGNPVLRIIDLSTETIIATYYLENYNLKEEPEIVSIDFSTNKLYYASLDGELRVLEISNV